MNVLFTETHWEDNGGPCSDDLKMNRKQVRLVTVIQSNERLFLSFFTAHLMLRT